MTDQFSPLLTAGPDQLSAIAARAAAVCIVFREHRLGAACEPPNADIAVEGSAGGVVLLVRRDVTYTGADEELSAWLTTGSREFADLEAAVAWLRRHLIAGTADGEGTGHSQETGQAESDGSVNAPSRLDRRPPTAVRAAHEVTDLEHVRVPPDRSVGEDDLAEAMGSEVLGQARAVGQLASLAARHAVKLLPRRPASALLVGPTGVGKTLAAECLATCLTDVDADGWGYLRLDMNEFSEQHSAARLFGSPPGYIGYGDGKDLAAQLRRQPRSVVLFDEIDKAHPRLWLSLMNLMDAGRLAGQSGEIDARRSILLFTSNRHAEGYARIARESAADPVRMQGQLRSALRGNGFAAEIVARLGTIAVFDELSGTVLTALVLHTLQRVVATYGVQLAFVEPAVVTDILAGMPAGSRGVRDLEYHLDERFGRELADVVRSTNSSAVRIVHAEPAVVAA